MINKTPYIAIEGNIGAGKTSLSRLLATETSANLLLETFEENPFLPLFYQNPTQHALAVELFFMTERQTQLQQWLLNSNLMQPLVADYVFSKTLIFAKENLAGAEWELFQKIFHGLNCNLPRPDLLVYIRRPIEELLANIKKRNRSYEQNIQADYLLRVENSYNEFFQKHQAEIPILIIEAAGCDFVHNPQHYQAVQQLISRHKVAQAGIIAQDYQLYL